MMRRLIATILILSACSDRPSRPRREPVEFREVTSTAPITDLEFNDRQLQAIATNLIREARSRGIEASPGRNRIECLLSLEASLGDSDLAVNRVNRLVADMTMTDASQWAKVRRRAEREFGNRHDDVARRVCEMLARWQRRRLNSVFRYLSSNYSTTYISSLGWEGRFHDFVMERPMDAATWGWLVLRDHRIVTRQQYGRADSEMAYRFYLESSGLGDGREARRVFSVPGIEVEAP